MADDRLKRRGLLLGGVGLTGLVVGVGGAEARDAITDASRPAPAVPATEDLMTDHGLLKRVLLIYREAARRLITGDQLDPLSVYRAAGVIHSYVEGFHEGMEEGYVFPVLRRANTLDQMVDTLLVQHDRGRKLTVSIIKASTPMAQHAGTPAAGFATAPGRVQLAGWLEAFVTMYEHHEAWEDTEIFPAFRRLTTEREFARISERFAETQQRRFGDDGFAAWLEQVTDIEKELGINDLSRYTPDVPPV